MYYFFKCLRQYADFKGRACRAEYWYYVLTLWLIDTCLTLSLAIAEADYVTILVWRLALYAVAWVPGLAVEMRRLHDIGRSGWWLLIKLVPTVGTCCILFFACIDSQPGANAYGPNPKEDAATAQP